MLRIILGVSMGFLLVCGRNAIAAQCQEALIPTVEDLKQDDRTRLSILRTISLDEVKQHQSSGSSDFGAALFKFIPFSVTASTTNAEFDYARKQELDAYHFQIGRAHV